MSTQDCQFCNRRGLPLLPLRLAYVPNHKTSLPSSLTSGNPNLHPVKDGAYALRIITEGYVYILDMRAGGFWRCFAATQTGHFKELPLDALPAQQPSFQCGRTGHANVSSIVSIERASEGDEVWVGYSRVHWTQATRAKIKQDANFRAAAMVQFNSAAVVTGGSLPPHSGLRLTSGDQLASLVGEYAKDETGFSHIDRLYANATTAGAAERRGQADELVKAMHHISPNNAIVLALPDTIGIAQDINHWRNIRAGELAKYQGDAAKLRTRIIGDMILDIESSMRKQGQGPVWDERYAPKVEMKKVRADKLAHTKKVTEIEARILRASDDWCKWTGTTQFKLAWQLYDGMDAQHGKSIGSTMERDFASCVFGSGATPKEQKWWEEYLTADPSDTNHALWLAFAAGDKDVVAFLKGDAAKPLDLGKLDKGIDLIKQSKDLAEKLREWHGSRASARLLRAAQAESGLLATTIASQLAVLGRAKPQAALIAGQRLRLVIVSRMEVLVTPYGQQVTLKQMVVQMHEAVWGPPKSQMSKVVQEARSLKIAQGIDGAWLGSKFTSTKVVAVEVWMPETAVGLGNSKASPKALPVPDTPILNPWQGLTQYIKNSKALGQGLLGLGAALQISNLSANLIQLDRASKGNAANRDDSITESLYGVVSGSLGLLALTGEVFAGSIAARAVPAAATAGTARLLTIAGWTALGGGYWGARQQALMHSNRLEKQTG